MNCFRSCCSLEGCFGPRKLASFSEQSTKNRSTSNGNRSITTKNRSRASEKWSALTKNCSTASQERSMTSQKWSTPSNKCSRATINRSRTTGNRSSSTSNWLAATGNPPAAGTSRSCPPGRPASGDRAAGANCGRPGTAPTQTRASGSFHAANRSFRPAPISYRYTAASTAPAERPTLPACASRHAGPRPRWPASGAPWHPARSVIRGWGLQ